MRLFAAVETSRATRDAMAAEQRRIAAALNDGDSSPKWTRPDQAHLTLIFLGAVDDAHVPAIIETMGRDLDVAPFDIVISGVGVFPERGAPKVLWAGIAAGGDALCVLRREVASRIAACGVAFDARDFHPHLTLGRWSRSRPSDRARVLALARPGLVGREHVVRATLYQSRISASGAAYHALARANLTGQ